MLFSLPCVVISGKLLLSINILLLLVHSQAYIYILVTQSIDYSKSDYISNFVLPLTHMSLQIYFLSYCLCTLCKNISSGRVLAYLSTSLTRLGTSRGDDIPNGGVTPCKHVQCQRLFCFLRWNCCFWGRRKWVYCWWMLSQRKWKIWLKSLWEKKN